MATDMMAVIDSVTWQGERLLPGDLCSISSDDLRSLHPAARRCFTKADDSAVRELVVGKAKSSMAEAERLVTLRTAELLAAEQAKAEALVGLSQRVEYAAEMLSQAKEILLEGELAVKAAEAPFLKKRRGRPSGGSK